MNREETNRLLIYLAGVYPSLKTDDLSRMRNMVDAWWLTLEPYEAGAMTEAAVYVARSTRDKFIPSPGDLIAAYEAITGSEAITASEAWGRFIVPAIRRGIYYAEEEYEKLPSACKTAVGSSHVLREWATMEQTALSVAQANFFKSYPAAVEKARMEFLLTGKSTAVEQIAATGSTAEIETEQPKKMSELPDTLEEFLEMRKNRNDQNSKGE